MICRVFQKSCGGKKIHISGLLKLNSNENEIGNSFLPPLTDSGAASKSSHVHCFSNFSAPQNNPSPFHLLSNPMDNFPLLSNPNTFSCNQIAPFTTNPGSFGVQDPSSILLRASLENYSQNFKKEEIFNVPQDTGVISTDMNTGISSIASNLDMKRRFLEDQVPSAPMFGLQGLDCLWSC